MTEHSARQWPAPARLVALMVLAQISFTGGRVALSLYALRLGAGTLTVGMLISLLSVLPLLFGGLGAATGMVSAVWILALILIAGGVFSARHQRR